MRPRVWATALWLGTSAALLACGPRAPGAEGGRTYYWQVTGSTVEFSQCTDDPSFRGDLPPISFDANSYFIYQVDTKATVATVMNCGTFNPSSCTPASPEVALGIAGNEYVFSTDSRSPLGTQGCQLLDSTTWSAIDEGPTLGLTITHVLSLVDNPTACAAAEQQITTRSPNMTGLQGCVVTFKIAAKL